MPASKMHIRKYMLLPSDYGLLINQDTKLHRSWFKLMTNLIGINVKYRAVTPGKHWTTYGEIDSNYEKPIVIGCIFNLNVDQKTMKKLGWVAELGDNSTIITVPYDTPNIQVGALFELPSGIDGAEPRLFRAIELSTSAIYPATITCRVCLEYKDNFDSSLLDHKTNSFNLLNEEDMKDLR